MRTPPDPKKLVKALQTGRRQLGMTDEEYRSLLFRRYQWPDDFQQGTQQRGAFPRPGGASQGGLSRRTRR